MDFKEVKKVKNDYSDLLDFGVITLKTNPSFNTILSYFDELETISKGFVYNGKKITAKRKFTYVGGQGKMFKIKTNYLHIWIEDDKKPYLTIHYKQQKDKSFKQI